MTEKVMPSFYRQINRHSARTAWDNLFLFDTHVKSIERF